MIHAGNDWALRSPAPVENPGELRTLVDRYLQEQQRLTAVERFGAWHERPHAETELARIYRSRLPATSPGPGEQFAFEVDLDLCTGCKACVTACHSLNGLDESESWRRVGVLLDPSGPSAFQHVTTACHHCVDPACMNGCPVLAYEKDPTTGIVRHLDDQCIGCSYCTLMCPYEVPQYSKRLGIVRKCDMCEARLTAGEAPACVQGCPNGAIRIEIVDAPSLLARLRTPAGDSTPASFLPDSPSPAVTVPSTRYRSTSGRSAPPRAADRHHAVPAPAHLPLTFFLVLSQASVGVLLAGLLPDDLRGLSVDTGIRLALVLQLAGLAIATFHLGRPLHAWRAFLGWRRSWFSREILAFGLYTSLLAALAATPWAASIPDDLLRAARATTGVIGLIAVATSAMIYASTRRIFWSPSTTFLRFFGTVAILGAATSASTALASMIVLPTFALRAAAATLRSDRRRAESPAATGRTRTLLAGPLRRFVVGSRLLSLLGIGCLGLGILGRPDDATGSVLVAGLLFAAAEGLDRHMFFTAVSPDRMPGGIPV